MCKQEQKGKDEVVVHFDDVFVKEIVKKILAGDAEGARDEWKKFNKVRCSPLSD